MSWVSDLLAKAATGELGAIVALVASAIAVAGGVIAAAVWIYRMIAERRDRREQRALKKRERGGRTEGLPYEAIEPERDTLFARLSGVAGDSTAHVTRPEVEEAVKERPDGLLVWGPSGCGKTREVAEYALTRANEMKCSKWCFVIDGSTDLKSPQGAPGRTLEGVVVIFDDLQKHWERHEREAQKGVAVGLHPGETICEILDYFSSEADSNCAAVATVRSEDETTWRAMCKDPCWKKALDRFQPHVQLGLVAETDVERAHLRAACEARNVTWSDEEVFETLVEANDGSFLTADEYLDELSADGEHNLTMEEAKGLGEACEKDWRERVLPKLPEMQQEAVELCSILSACGFPLERKLVLALDCERKCAGRWGKSLYGWGRGRAFGRALDALAKGTFPESDGVFRPHSSRLADKRRPELKEEAAEVGEALTAYEAGLEIRERLAGQAPSDLWRQRDLSVSHNKIGDVRRAQGDLPGALEAYETGLEIRERLVAQDPGNTEWQGELSVSHNNIGDVRRAQGDLPGALKAHEARLAIAERLAAQDPGNAGWQRDLSVSHNRIGNVRVAQGDLPGALKAYEADLEIAERLAAQDPGNAGWQRDLSMSHIKIGDVRVAQGDLTRALAAYRASLAICERLAASDPGNAEWQRDLSVSHNRIGNVRVAQGDLPGALEAYEADLEIAERLAAQDPGNAQWQRDLSMSHIKIGDVRRAQGDLPRALAAYEAGLEIAEQLAAQDPGNAEWQRDLSMSHIKIGDVRRAQGDLAEALAAYEASLEIRKRLAAQDTGNAEWQRDLWVSYWRMADMAEEMGRGDAAEWWRKAHVTLAGMKERGMHLTPEDEGFLEQLREKVEGTG